LDATPEAGAADAAVSGKSLISAPAIMLRSVGIQLTCKPLASALSIEE
jgi:hypothetical protein